MTKCALCDPDAARPGTESCNACSRQVCASHYRVMYGLCKACATDEGLARLREGGGKRRPRDFLDIKWVEE